MVTRYLKFIFNCDEQRQLKARVARGWYQHSPHTDFFFLNIISAIKCNISILNPHLETTIGREDLTEHQAELGGAKVRAGFCTCHCESRKSVSSPRTRAVIDSAAALDQTLQTGLQCWEGLVLHLPTPCASTGNLLRQWFGFCRCWEHLFKLKHPGCAALVSDEQWCLYGEPT